MLTVVLGQVAPNKRCLSYTTITSHKRLNTWREQMSVELEQAFMPTVQKFYVGDGRAWPQNINVI
jgi:hypothetical protein